MTQAARHLFADLGLATAAPSGRAMPDQDLTRPFRDPAAPKAVRPAHAPWARLLVLALPAAISLSLAHVALGWFRLDGHLSLAEIAVSAVSVLFFYWIALSNAAALAGLVWRPADPATPEAGLRVAVLLLLYGEDADAAVGRAVRLVAGLSAVPGPHRFGLRVLSDTPDPTAATREALAVARLRRSSGLPIGYRRREANTDFKSGNIRDWVVAEGGDFDAALILDADSRMGTTTVRQLADALASDPTAGLVQTIPLVAPGESLWQRLQSFASRIYGQPLGRGFALWAGSEANFLGHNALVRLAAFASAAGLPHLSGRRPFGGVILSHDFVEAALIRRAGWAVRMLPEAAESHEEAPAHLPAHVRRDTRWCQGNMQHLRLLAVPGLHPLSRFHLWQGAMAYLASVWWLAVLALWAGLGPAPDLAGAAAAPWRLVWPEPPVLGQAGFAAIVALTLLGPKLIGVADYLLRVGVPKGGRLRFAAAFAVEAVTAVLVAPVMMVHQSRAVLRMLAGVDGGWPAHLTGRPTLAMLVRFHALETLAGGLLLALIAAGGLSPWLLPVALGLVLAVPVSVLMAGDGRRFPVFPAARRS